MRWGGARARVPIISRVDEASMLAIRRSSRARLDCPSAPPKCQRGSCRLPLPLRGTRAPPLCWAAWRWTRLTDDSEVAHKPAMVEVRTPIAAKLSMMAAAEASTTAPLGGCSPAGGIPPTQRDEDVRCDGQRGRRKPFRPSAPSEVARLVVKAAVLKKRTNYE